MEIFCGRGGEEAEFFFEYRQRAADFAAIAVDELTRNEEETFHFLRSRLRWPGIDRPKFLAATNDSGVIFLPDGRQLAVSVYVKASTRSSAVRDQVIARIARAAVCGEPLENVVNAKLLPAGK